MQPFQLIDFHHPPIGADVSLVSLLPTRFLLVAADVRPPFLPPFLPAAAFLDLVFAGLFDFALAMILEATSKILVYKFLFWIEIAFVQG
jgi:hypothetical protein